jgi:hypothetical protein
MPKVVLAFGGFHSRIGDGCAGEQAGQRGRRGDLVPGAERLDQRRLDLPDAPPELAAGRFGQARPPMW